MAKTAFMPATLFVLGYQLINAGNCAAAINIFNVWGRTVSAKPRGREWPRLWG